jgi:RNA polymerase sigma factor (sigma-70 family)
LPKTHPDCILNASIQHLRIDRGIAVALTTHLAAELRARRAGVLDDLLTAYGREIQGVAYLITRDHADAEEVLMDTLVSAWRKADGLRDDRALRTWLLRIATRHALSRRRSLRRTQRLEVDLPLPARKTDEPSLDRLIVAEAMADLAPQMRAAVALRYFAGLSVPEVAKALGKSVNTVKSHLRVGLERLRTALDVPGWDDESTIGDA